MLKQRQNEVETNSSFHLMEIRWPYDGPLLKWPIQPAKLQKKQRGGVYV